jgi:hypothetical protein
MTDQPYTREELLSKGDHTFPDRGSFCPKCQTRIPEFRDLTPEIEAELRELVRYGKDIEAIKRLRDVTRCPVAWSKIWVLHSEGPNTEHDSAPCPYCGETLRTSRAKQCRHCKRDWHDPEKVTYLGGPDV